LCSRSHGIRSREVKLGPTIRITIESARSVHIHLRENNQELREENQITRRRRIKRRRGR